MTCLILRSQSKSVSYALSFYLLMLGAFVIFFRLGDRDMWNGLESESAIAGWDMVETGRILIPHILRQPFIDNRPPGAWWLIAATYKLTGVRNTWTARLPSALATLGCILLVYAMGRRTANARTGFVSALILMGMLYFILLDRTSQQDMLLTLATTLCLWAFWRSLANNESVFCFVMAFQIFLGFGVLIKGPAVVINLFSSLAVYVLYSRRWRDVKWASFIVTLPVSLCLSLWWYIYVWVNWLTLREWGMFAILGGIVTWSWMMWRAGRRRTSWKIAWISCIIALAFFVGDIYQRAGNTLISRTFAEKVARTVPDNARLGTLDDHTAILFHLGRPVKYLQVATANNYLENANHYLIVHKQSNLEQIDGKFRRTIVLEYPYRHRRTAYLLQGGQSQDNYRLSRSSNIANW